MKTTMTAGQERRHNRNREIVGLATDGVCHSDIADRFGIAKSTVHHVLKSCGVSTRVSEEVRRTLKEAKDDQFCLDKYGCTRKEWVGMDKAKKERAAKLLKSSRINAYKITTKIRGEANTLKLMDIYSKLGDKCPVFRETYRDSGDFVPSVDRIDATLGYTPENIQVISWRANFLKSNGSPEEFELLAKFLAENSGNY